MKHAALIVLLAALTTSAAQAATQRPGLYWSKATMTALFTYTVNTQQIGHIIPGDATVTVACQGLARYDGIHGPPDYLTTNTGRRFRYFLCTAHSTCWSGGQWQVRYTVLLDATPSAATNATRVRSSQENVPHPNAAGC